MPLSLFAAALGLMSGSIQSRIEGSGCERTIWYSENTKLCLVPKSSRKSVSVITTVGRQVGSATEGFSLDTFVIIEPGGPLAWPSDYGEWAPLGANTGPTESARVTLHVSGWSLRSFRKFVQI